MFYSLFFKLYDQFLRRANPFFAPSNRPVCSLGWIQNTEYSFQMSTTQDPEQKLLYI